MKSLEKTITRMSLCGLIIISHHWEYYISCAIFCVWLIVNVFKENE